MARRCLWVLGLASVAAAAAGAIAVDFAKWDAARWVQVRENRFPRVVPFVQQRGYIENYIEPGHTEEDVVAAKDGLGVAILLLRDWTAADAALRCQMAFEGKGAPAILLRVQRQGEVTGCMYSLVMYEKGLNLWRYDGKTWGKVGASEFEVRPGEFHELRVYARSGAFSAYLDGERRLLCEDPEPLPAGEIGIWSGEGPCRFRTFQVRPLYAQ